MPSPTGKLGFWTMTSIWCVAVDAHRLLVEVRIVPVVEDAVAAAHGGLLVGVPGERRARREVELVVRPASAFPGAAPRLTDSVFASRKSSCRNQPRLDLRVVDQRVADADAVGGGLAERCKRQVAGERVGAVAVRALRAVPPAGLEQHAGAHRVLAADGEVEVLRDLDLAARDASPDWPAPPAVKASLTRTVGAVENGVVVGGCLTNSNLSSLNTFLPITRVLRRRKVSVLLSVS